MNRIYAEGTLGDSFVFMLKIREMKERVIVYHKTKWIHWYGAIKEIYSLTNNVELRFTDERRTDLPEVLSDPHTGKMSFFPEFDIVSRYNFNKPYIVITPSSGKPVGYNAKKLPPYMINELVLSIARMGIKCVLLGTDTAYTDIQGCVNLIGYTSIQDCLAIIQKCEQFIGPEGLLLYMALSQKKHSIGFYSDYEAVEKRVVGTPWEEHCKLVDMRNIGIIGHNIIDALKIIDEVNGGIV